MHFQSRTDLEAHISQRIGDIDSDVDRDAVVSLIAQWVIDDANFWGINYGDDWSESLAEVLPEDGWPDEVAEAVDFVREATEAYKEVNNG